MDIVFAGLLCHLVGDYLLQSDWMALNKSKDWRPCLVHCILYTACFLVITTSWQVLGIIFGTHYLIDRFGLVRYLIWLKNHLNPRWKYDKWSECRLTGYSVERPLWLTLMLMIVGDNTLHLIINSLVLSTLCTIVH